MKTIFLILILSTLIFATDGDTLITTFELPAVTANNDSLLQWFVDVLSSDSTDTTTRRLTYSVLLDLMKNDSTFSEQSFTAAFNARLDSLFPHQDSSVVRGLGYTWHPQHKLYMNNTAGTARIDSLL